MGDDLKGNNGLLRKTTSIVVVLLIFTGLFYFVSSSILVFLDENMPNISFSRIRKYDQNIRLFMALVLACLFVIVSYKKVDFIAYSRGWIITFGSSLLLSILLHILLRNCICWYLKYFFIGTSVGIISYILNKKRVDSSTGYFSGVLAILVSLFGGELEYLLTMEPPIYPSILYINSFANTILWICLLLALFFLAYFLSKGVLIKKIIK